MTHLEMRNFLNAAKSLCLDTRTAQSTSVGVMPPSAQDFRQAQEIDSRYGEQYRPSRPCLAVTAARRRAHMSREMC